MSDQKIILVVASNPSDQSRLRLDKEVRDINEGLRLSKHREQFVLRHQWATRIRDLRRAMQEHQPTIVHFCGHGNQQGIALESDDGKTQLVDTKALGNFFSLFTNHVECVVLNSCFSERQASEIRQYIPYVIGMIEGIGDKAAIEFSVAFYDSLASGSDYEMAYKFGCNAIEMFGTTEHFIPKILKKDNSTSLLPSYSDFAGKNVPYPKQSPLLLMNILKGEGESK